MSYYGFAPYVSVAEKKAKADKAIEKLRKKNKDLEPVYLDGKSLVSTWWGKAWNQNLEGYADYSNRISRGKTYVRNHMVLDLKIVEGRVDALVQGSGRSPYTVTVNIDTLEKTQWEQIAKLCDRCIASLDQLIEGKFPKELAGIFTDRAYGLFPSPKQIHFDCSCPDYAYMCKHVAAVLYGIGARLDKDPQMFFKLRNVNCEELLRRSVESRLDYMLKNADEQSLRVIEESEAVKLFGIELD